MFPLDLVLAVACIVSPVEELPCSPVAMQRVAVSMELMDAREAKYLFTRSEDSRIDLALIHRRYNELREAPPACDAERWIDRELCNKLIQFNREYVEALRERKRLFREDWIEEAVQEAEYLYRVYDLVRDARCEYYYVTVRRKALLDLRKEIGFHAYYVGTLPPIVPAWRLRRND